MKRMQGMRLSRRHLLSVAALPSLTAFDAEASIPDDKARRYRFRVGPALLGGAILKIHASQDQVMRQVQKYRQYHRILPRMDRSQVLQKKGKAADVYLRAPILGGVANVWGVTHFREPEPWRTNGRRIRAHLVKGNVDDFYGSWKMRPAD
ncbi:MAG: SRPBCC family protein, partial [Myxococcota bacterium]